MDGLRLILLGAGLVFLVLLGWFGGRRTRRERADPADAAGPRNEPSMGDARPASGWQASPQGTAPMLSGREAPPLAGPDDWHSSGLRSDPPVIDWSEAVAASRAEPHLAGIESMPVMQGGPSDGARVELVGFDEGVSGPSYVVGHAQLLPPPAEPAELVIAWPPEPERYIASLRVVAGPEGGFGGRLLRQSLAACGFRHGPFGIFHFALEDGRVIVSAASLVRPGLLEPATMDFQQYPGLNLFAVLPAPIASATVLERLAHAAQELAERLGGEVQDEGGALLDSASTPGWRALCLARFAQREPPTAAGEP